MVSEEKSAPGGENQTSIQHTQIPLVQPQLSQSQPPVKDSKRKVLKMSLILLGILILFIVVACALLFINKQGNKKVTNANNEIGSKKQEIWKKYIGETQGYSLEYPSSYKLTTESVHTIFLEKDNITFSIHIDYPQKLGLDNPKIEKVSLDGHQADKFTYLINGKIVAATYKFIYLDKEYEIDYIKRTKDAKYLALTDYERDTIDRIIKSIKFQSPTKSDPYDDVANWDTLTTDYLTFKYSPYWPLVGDENDPSIELDSPNLMIAPVKGVDPNEEDHDICWKISSTEQKDGFYIEHLSTVVGTDSCQITTDQEYLTRKILRVKKSPSKTAPYLEFLYSGKDEQRVKTIIDKVIPTLEFTQ